MPFLTRGLARAAALLGATACSSPAHPGAAQSTDAASDASPFCTTCASSNIQHLVIIVQENHTFDNHFGAYCTAPTGSSPACTDGPACCEAAPATDPTGVKPTVLDDDEMGNWDPDHTEACELTEMDGGKMDMYASAACGSPENVAYSDPDLVKPYWDLATGGALADRYFQPLVGESSSNDMYFARADFVFSDNSFEPLADGAECGIFAFTPRGQYKDTTIADLLLAARISFGVYAGGYQAMLDAEAMKTCPFPAPPLCAIQLSSYPCIFDPSDIPFEYYPSTVDDPKIIHDISRFALDLAAGTLPSVSYVKAIGYETEHPGSLDRLSDGVDFVTQTVAQIEQSPLASSTLVLVTYDEGGGYFDHVTPPPASAVDGKPYGTRVPMMAIGPLAAKGQVSHVVMEHSSVVKFIEWNWLGGTTGQLHTRDAVVSGLGSLIDQATAGVAVPE